MHIVIPRATTKNIILKVQNLKNKIGIKLNTKEYLLYTQKKEVKSER